MLAPDIAWSERRGERYPASRRPMLRALVLAGVLSCIPLCAQGQELRGAFNDPSAVQAADGAPLAEDPASDLNFPTYDIYEDSGPPPLTDASESPPRRVRTADDPYAPLGIRAGALLFIPSVEQFGGYESNPRAEKDGEGSAFSRTVGRLDLASDWARHQLRGTLQAGYVAYRDMHDLDAPDFLGDLGLRLDARRDVTIDLAVRGSISSESPGDPELPEGIDGRQNVISTGATVGATYKPNRLSLGAQLLADRFVYEDAKLNDGTPVDNSARTYNSYEVRQRTGYELSPALEPFVELSVNRRVHDREADDFGIRHDSTGFGAVAGVRFEPSPLLAIEVGIGYGEQRPEEETLETLDAALITEGSLIWRPTALTTVTLLTDTELDETTLTGSPGAVVRTAAARIEHSLRRNLILTGNLIYARTDYVGIDYVTNETTADLGIEYRVSPTMAVKARVAHLTSESTIPDEDYTSNLIELGVRFQR